MTFRSGFSSTAGFIANISRSIQCKSDQYRPRKSETRSLEMRAWFSIAGTRWILILVCTHTLHALGGEWE